MHIFVEGNSDKTFLSILLDYYNINATIETTDGKDNLKNLPKIKKYNNPVIIFDADNDYITSKNNIINQINSIDKNISPSIYLLPDNENIGTLENINNNNNFKGVNPKSQLFAYLEVFGFKHINSSKKIDYKDIFNLNHEKILKIVNFLKSVP